MKPTTRGWLCYDADCPVCARTALRFGGVIVRRGYKLTPLGRAWVRERLAGDPQVADEIQLLLSDGRRLGGVDALLHLAREIWWARPFAWIGLVGCVGAALRRMYAWVARNRMRISRTCGLDTCGRKR